MDVKDAGSASGGYMVIDATAVATKKVAAYDTCDDVVTKSGHWYMGFEGREKGGSINLTSRDSLRIR